MAQELCDAGADTTKSILLQPLAWMPSHISFHGTASVKVFEAIESAELLFEDD